MIDGKYNEPVEVARRMLKDRDIQACVHCGAVVDYVPEYCCDGSRGCPCMGYPLYPPLCDKCDMYGDFNQNKLARLRVKGSHKAARRE